MYSLSLLDSDQQGVDLDYLMSEDEKQEVIDNSMLQRVREIQRLAKEDQDTIINVIDAFIRDTKTTKAYAQ